MTMSVIGVLVASAVSVYHPVAGVAQEQRTGRFLEGIKQSLIAFSMTHRRLPCADINGDGYEGNGSGCGAPGGFQVGKVPYATLGISSSGASGSDIKAAHIIYGVYRNSSVVDLAAAGEQTGDPRASVSGFNNMNDFLKMLTRASVATTNHASVYVGGLDVRNRTVCTSGENVAFVLASAGMMDADGDGSLFDGVNKLLTIGGVGRCFSSPVERASSVYDDVVISMGFNELAGFLSAGLD